MKCIHCQPRYVPYALLISFIIATPYKREITFMGSLGYLPVILRYLTRIVSRKTYRCLSIFSSQVYHSDQNWPITEAIDLHNHIQQPTQLSNESLHPSMRRHSQQCQPLHCWLTLSSALVVIEGQKFTSMTCPTTNECI